MGAGWWLPICQWSHVSIIRFDENLQNLVENGMQNNITLTIRSIINFHETQSNSYNFRISRYATASTSESVLIIGGFQNVNFTIFDASKIYSNNWKFKFRKISNILSTKITVDHWRRLPNLECGRFQRCQRLRWLSSRFESPLMYCRDLWISHIMKKCLLV